MIDSFLESYEYLKDSYHAALAAAVMLSLVGSFLVIKRRYFEGAALAQAATLGVTVSLVFGLGAVSLISVLFAVVTAFVMNMGERFGYETGDKFTSWFYLFAMAFSVVLVAGTAHGMHEVANILSASLLGTPEEDMMIFALMAVVVAILLSVFYKPFLLLCIDIDMAQAVGMRVTRWLAALSVVMGVCVGYSVTSLGLLFCFSCLVIPFSVASNLVRESKKAFIFTPIISFVTVFISFVLANHYDVPLAQMASLCLCALLPVSWIFKKARRA